VKPPGDKAPSARRSSASGAGPRRRHTVVFSDVHLSQAHPDDPTDPLWMRYRTARFHPDADFERLVSHLLTTCEGDALDLVFNGDLFDFDAPWVIGEASSFDEFPLDDAGCAAQVRRIIADHPRWFRAVARALIAGHRVMFLSGNHDLELYWPGVRAAIREELVALCRSEGADDTRGIAERVRFRTWFHVTEDRIYLEHGSQYDIFNGVRWPMLPLRRDRSWIHPVMGKLAFKRTGSRMGYFNPYYEETFYMGLFGYLGHFLRFYARSRRHIVRTWFWGGVSTVGEIWRHRHDEDWSRENRALAREETGATLEQIDATQALRAEPAEDTMLPIARELWLDRAFLAATSIALVALAAIALGPVAALAVLGAILGAFTVYELRTPKPDIRTYDSAPPAVKSLLDIHGVRAVCMGHTHRPFGAWEAGRFYGNSGSWCPAFLDQDCTQPVLDGRPFLRFTSEGDELRGGLCWWRGGAIVLADEASSPPAALDERAPEGPEASRESPRREAAAP
jgi:UDP-2,3-diacylglucosamine pyrophosphatase LpxH